MPSVQLTKGNTQICQAQATANAGTAIGANLAASLTLIRGISLASATQQYVPVNEYWYITGIFLNPNQTPSIAHALLLTYVNSVPQPFAPEEDEVQQGTYNKLTLPSTEWIQLPSGISWQQAIQPTATVTTTTTTVTFQESILRMPLQVLK